MKRNLYGKKQENGYRRSYPYEYLASIAFRKVGAMKGLVGGVGCLVLGALGFCGCGNAGESKVVTVSIDSRL